MGRPAFQITDHYEYKVIPISEIVPRDINPRTHSPEQIGQLRASIEEWGFTNPILIDEEGVIIAGHGRLEAAQGLLTEIPTITISGLTDDQKRALVIADNQLAVNAGWDLDLLKNEISTLDFDIDLLGFDDDFINTLTQGFDAGSIDDQGDLTQLDPIMVVCPECGKEFDARSKD